METFLLTPSAPITIVSGLPRSGTSVMMQLIHAGGLPALTDEVRAADIDNPHGYFEYEPVKKTKADSSWLAGAGGKVVKMVHLLLLDLPLDKWHVYQVVMTRREPDEVIASQTKMLQRLNRGGGALPTEQLQKIYAHQLEKVYAFMAAHPASFKTITVSYNELIGNPASGAAAVNAFLGGSLDEAKMRAAIDPTLYRNRKG